MALSTATLGGMIKTNVKNIEGITISNDTELEKFCAAIAGAVVDHIRASAEVTVASGIRVETTGSAAAQTGATTETGSGTVA